MVLEASSIVMGPGYAAPISRMSLRVAGGVVKSEMAVGPYKALVRSLGFRFCQTQYSRSIDAWWKKKNGSPGEAVKSPPGSPPTMLVYRVSTCLTFRL